MPGIVAAVEQLVHALDVVRVDVLLVGERDGRRLLVRALAETHAALERIARSTSDHVR